MTSRSGYSAKVALTLKVDDQDISLSHVGPGLVRLRENCGPMPPSDAQLLIQVDEHSELMNVYLPSGISRDSREVAYF
jgi:hypothetical protein